MKTKIINSIQQWVPESGCWIPEIESSNSSVSDYLVLKKTAQICIEKINAGAEKDLEYVKEILKIINLLYQGGNQYTRNAIENEFLTELSQEESPFSFKKHLNLFPSQLKNEYIKTILEN